MGNECDLDFSVQKAKIDWVVALEQADGSRDYSTSATFSTRDEARGWKKKMKALHKSMKITNDVVTIYRRATTEWYAPSVPSNKEHPLPMTMIVMRKAR